MIAKNPCKICVSRPVCTKKKECEELRKYEYETFGGNMGRLFGVFVKKIENMEWEDVFALTTWATAVSIIILMMYVIIVPKKVMCYYPETEFKGTQVVYVITASIDWAGDSEHFKTTDLKHHLEMFSKLKICGGKNEEGKTVNSNSDGDVGTGGTKSDL